MKAYSRSLRCVCGAQFWIVATRTGEKVSSSAVACPTCRRSVAFDASCQLDEASIEIADVARR